MLTHSFTNTAHKFKFRQLTAKFNTYKQYWNRILRKIEEGTYERDQFLLAHKDKIRAESQGTNRNHAAANNNNREEKKDTSTASHHDLYNKLLDAKLQCNENTDRLYFNDFSKKIETQSKQLKEKYNCKDIEFKVVIESGKTKLKAIPKK